MSISPSARVHCFASALCFAVALAVVSLLLPTSAGAYATPGPAPVPGSPGLPDGRIYELVSPANKPGTEAAPEKGGKGGTIWAAADGDGVAFNTSGAVGAALAGREEWSVARRSAGGWKTYGAIPLPLGGVFRNLVEVETHAIGFSADFTKSIFMSPASYVVGEPAEQGIYPQHVSGYIHNTESNSTAWLGEPFLSSPPVSFPGYADEEPTIIGASSDLSTAYFFEHGEYYEWHEGRVSPVGVLPDGSLDPYGAVPAGFSEVLSHGYADLQTAEDANNEVSEDGARAFFVSPNPSTAYPAGDPPELYVHETAADGTQSTVLVSRDKLPAVNGLPAPAPHGPRAFTAANGFGLSGSAESKSYMWATPDGSRAFFLSTDQLTPEAPADDSGKMYEFDLETNTLTYLADGTPPTTEPNQPAGTEVLASSQDGSRILFVKFVSQPVKEGGPPQHLLTELDLWTDGPEGPSDGYVTPIAPLGDVEASEVFPFVRASSDGSSFVFETNDPFSGFNFNNNGFYPGGGAKRDTQVYRYDVATSSLDCLSCPPTGVNPSGPAQLSTNNVKLSYNKDRGISEDGSRVFFDTPDPLVPWDHNTAPPLYADSLTVTGFVWRDYDVYAWENGKLYLISTGNSNESSYVGDNSANGNNVFFSTAEGLVPGDTDGGGDVYDARIPEPGEKPASAVPCEGEVCQGPPSTPSLLGAPASATFSGLGNQAPAVSAPAAKPVLPKSLTGAQRLALALKACGKQPKRKRAGCKAQARKKYADKAKKSNRGGR